MTVKFTQNQSLSFYAKLLANENISVVHANVPTAAFHPDSKTVILPIFGDHIPEETKVHLASHEVSHFLNPADYTHEVKENKRNAGVLNIIDDVRIERDIQERFVGLRPLYKKSYQYIQKSGLLIGKSDFKNKTIAPTENDETSELFISRLNCHLKLNTVGKTGEDIEFSSEEMVGVKACEKVKTWDDVLEAHDLIMKLHKEDMKKHPGVPDPTENYDDINTSDMTSDFDGQEMTLEEFIEKLESGEISPEDVRVVKNNKKPKKGKKSKKKGKLRSNKSKSSQNNEQREKNSTFDLVDNFEPEESCLIELNYVTHKIDGLVSFQEAKKTLRETSRSLNTFTSEDISNYLREQKPSVSAMVGTFNRKKNAKKRLNIKVGKSGDLDHNKAVFYQTTERIFKRKHVYSKQDNYGFFMLLDFSGSMDDVIDKISWQVIRLCEFCRMVSIPYAVYIFTTDYGFSRDKSGYSGISPVGGNSIVEVLNSNGKARENFETFKNICNRRGPYSMGGTPIYYNLMSSPKLISEFQHKHNLDKINFFLFTDGVDTSGFSSKGEKYDSIGDSTISIGNFKAKSLSTPECYFDDINTFYMVMKRIFNIHITTFFMCNNPQYSFNEQVSQEYENSSKELFKTNAWGDTFFSMPEEYFEDKKSDRLFATTLMENII